MGDGIMKFTADETKTIIQALEEHRGTHCYNHYEDNYEWEHSFEKRWGDEIENLKKRFVKSAERKVKFDKSIMEKMQVGDEIVLKPHERNVLTAYVTEFKKMGKEVVMGMGLDGWKLRRIR